ncbi:MAG TPA: serine hydrolase [Longimicrobiales bacterium]|nr:serine hydrolase [Longimicrobiales bacterium]
MAALFAATLAACLTEPQLKVRSPATPTDVGDGWAVSTPEKEGLDGEGLDRALDLFYSDTAFHNAVALLVARHGHLVLEAYARDASERERKRNIQSATKSVTSLVFGITRDRGYFGDLDQPLHEILTQDFGSDPRKKDITLRHLLTMTSGIAFDNDDFTVELLVDRPGDPVAHILDKPLYAEPGDSFYYRDADPQLLSAAVTRVTGETLEQIARTDLFQPLGITDFHWEADGAGTTLGPIGLFLRPRDRVKVGQLVLSRGIWQGRRLVSEQWIELSTSTQVMGHDPEAPYGFYWWIVPELGAVTAMGHGGNYIFVARESDLVIVLESLPHANADAGAPLDRFLGLARLVVAAAR